MAGMGGFPTNKRLWAAYSPSAHPAPTQHPPSRVARSNHLAIWNLRYVENRFDGQTTPKDVSKVYNIMLEGVRSCL